MNHRETLWISLVFAAFPATVLPYEVTTHETLSDLAAKRSVLNGSASPLLDWGYGLLQVDTFATPELGTRTGLGLIVGGSNYEDDTLAIKRPYNHFHDPQHQRGLDVFCSKASPRPIR